MRPGQTHREVLERIAVLGRYATGPSLDEIRWSDRALVERDGAPSTRYRELADGRTLAITTRAMLGAGGSPPSKT